MKALSLVSLLAFLACSGKESAQPASAASSPAPAPSAAPTVADTGATLNPPVELSMELQHHTMMMIGDGYAKLVRALGDSDTKSAVKHATNMAAFADRIPAFMIHVPDAPPDSLVVWARILKGQVLRVADLSASDSLPAAQEQAQLIVLTCGKCHAKYQAPHGG
ncbi:MAG: hypothetical protein HY560_08755 [Gemmatimonadetes bacterium]|nr:hypothetical protein [Gemmatimonadota bacterium]